MLKNTCYTHILGTLHWSSIGLGQDLGTITVSNSYKLGCFNKKVLKEYKLGCFNKNNSGYRFVQS